MKGSTLINWLLIVLSHVVLLAIIFGVPCALASESVCYYYDDSARGWELPRDNCIEFSELMSSIGINGTSIVNLDDMDLNATYDTIYISGYGTEDGLITSISGGLHMDMSIIPWSKIADINANLLLIDACYSGGVYDYPAKAKTVITSAGKTLSWNIVTGDKNISSFIVMLQCLFNPTYTCPANISACGKAGSLLALPDPQTCQFNLIITNLSTPHRTISLGADDYHKSVNVDISTVRLNGKPWRK